MSKTIPDLDVATSLQGEDQFLFYQNSTKKAKRVSRKNMFSSAGIIVQGKVIDPDLGDLGLAAAAATNAAALASSTANGSQTSANGKNQIFYSENEPTPTAVFTGSISATTLTVTAVASGTVTIGKVITNGSKGILTGTTIKAFVSGTNGGVGVYTLSLSNPTIGSGAVYSGFIYNDLWFDTNGGYRMAKWSGSVWEDFGLETQAIANLDAGKITAGFIGAQVISINGANGGTSGTNGAGVGAGSGGGYIESSSYVPTWVSGLMTVRIYGTSGTSATSGIGVGVTNTLGKQIASDVVQVKVLEDDGSYKVFRSLTDQGTSATGAPPAAGVAGSNANWSLVTTPPTFLIPISPTENATLENFGFRIASNGFSEFSGGLFRGAIIAKEGFFGTTKNAARIDSNGLTIGNYGRIKSAGIGYNGTNFTATGGSGGFFLGNTQAEAEAELYQFFIGNPSGNYLRWDGTNLSVNGEFVANSTSGPSGAGVTIASGFGIRYVNDISVLTITGGSGNGVQSGAQIDFVGSAFDTSASDTGNGQLILQAGYKSSNSFQGPFDGAMVFRTSLGSTSGTSHIGIRRMMVALDGTVTIGGTGDPVVSGSPNAGNGKLIVETSVSSPTYTSTSSKRFKKKIKNLKNGLSIVGSLRPVMFDWKTRDLKNDIGLIAEEVECIIPTIIGYDQENKVSGIDYSKLTVVLIQAVKELSLEVERLKNKIK